MAVPFSQRRAHDAPHLLEMLGSKEMRLLSVEASAIHNGSSHRGFPFPGYRYRSDSARGGAEVLQLGIHQRVSVSVPVMPYAQIFDLGDRGLAGAVLPGPSIRNGRSVYLLLSVVKDHVVPC